MDLSKIKDVLTDRFPSPIRTIDSHTAGEPTRLIIDGTGPAPGRTMREKRQYFMENLDHVRLALTREPRGHKGMFVAHVTEPVSENADFGLIYMDPRRYPYLCGHATIGAVTTLIEIGAIEARGPEQTVIVDTPSGLMETKARIKDNKVESVAIQAVPSFVYESERDLDLPDLGAVPVHTVCVGGFFVMVDAGLIDPQILDLNPENRSRLSHLGKMFIEEANRQLTVRHPERPEVKTVDVVEFYSHDHGSGNGKSLVIYGEDHLDRSPCGTGTTAKMTLLHHRGQISPGQIYTNAGPLNTTFEARVVTETKVGDLPAAIVEIRGSAHITGVNDFVFEPSDPFPQGYSI